MLFPTGLDRLPPEILLRVFSCLKPKDVAKLAQVNQYCSRLAPDSYKRACFFVLAAKANKLSLVVQVIDDTSIQQRQAALMGAAKNGHVDVLRVVLERLVKNEETTQQVSFDTEGCVFHHTGVH